MIDNKTAKTDNRIIIKERYFHKWLKKFMDMSVESKILLLLCIFVMVCSVMYTFAQGSSAYFSSDTASTNTLVNEIIRSHKYFPPEWCAGQDLPFFSLTTFMIPLQLFIDDMLTVRAISCLIFMLLAVLSIIYWSRKVTDNNCCLITIPLIFCGVCEEYSITVLGQSGYLPVIIYVVFFITLYCDCVDGNYIVTSKIKFGLLLFFIALIGCNGERQVQIYGLPLLGAILIDFVIKNLNEPFKNVIKKCLPIVLKLLYIGIAIICGYIGYKYFSSKGNFFSVASSISFSDFDFFERIKTFFNLFLSSMGISYGISLISVEGIKNLIRIIVGILIFIVFPILQIKKFKSENQRMQLFILFAIVHIAEILILSLFCDVLGDSARYLFSSEFLLFFLSSNYIFKYLLKKRKTLLNVMVIVSLVIYAGIASLPKAKVLIDYKDELAISRDLTNHLKDEGLTFGYATYWNASNNTVYSNGEVEINGINLGNKIEPYYWLTSKQRYTDEAHTGKSFLMLTPEENNLFMASSSYTDFGQPLNYEEYGGFCIYSYDYNISHNNFEGVPWRNKELVNQMDLLNAEMTENGIVMPNGGLIYGPYMSVKSGSYKIDIDCDEIVEPIDFHLSSDTGGNIIKTGLLTSSTTHIGFSTVEDLNNFEIVLNNNTSNNVVINSIKITEVSTNENNFKNNTFSNGYDEWKHVA